MTTLRNYLVATAAEIKKASSEIQKMAADVGEGHGTLGPDQVKEILNGVASHMSTAGEGLKKAVDGIPSSQSTEDESEPDEEDDTMIASDDKKGDYGLESEFEPKSFSGKSDKKKSKVADGQTDKKLLEEVASLSATVKDLLSERAAIQKEKIATEFSSLFAPAMRQAKYNEMIADKSEVKILQAKLETAKSLLGNQKMASGRDFTKLNPENYPVFSETMTRVASMRTSNSDLIVEAF